MENKLEQLDEFKKILANYQVSELSKQILNRTKLVLMTSASAAGRNTIIRELLKTDEFHYIVSDTTRKPRVNDGVLEQNGREYWFRAEEELLQDLRNGKFLEAAIIHDQQVSGISIRELEQASQDQKVAISEVEVVGTDNIVHAKPDTIAIFILPPSFEAWMERLDGRGDMPHDEKRRRLESAVKEFQAALDHDYYVFVVNDNLKHAVQQVQALAHQQIDIDEQKHDRALVSQLLADTQTWLQKVN